MKWIIGILIACGIFSAGLFLGAYYANEISVLLRAYTSLEILNRVSNETSPISSTSPAPIEDTSSFISLSTLNEPLPLIFSETLDEPTLQEYLKQGAVVLPLGTAFGEPGNVVVTAHSSGGAAFGPYRFAFSKLSELKDGDTFTVTTPDETFTYKVYGQEIVWPHEVDRLPNDDRSTVTLVTCWPLWTNFKRLLVHSELIETVAINQ